MREKYKALLHKCAQYCTDSYATDLHVESHEHVSMILEVSTDTKVYIIHSNNTIYVTGPGSESLTDWSLDFQIWRTRVSYFNDSLVHAGFMKIYDSIKIKLHQILSSIILHNNIDTIVCTGHSLFGAVSTIIAADCSIRYESTNIVCVTFGSPRVGNNKFAKFFNDNVDTSFRCVFAKDPITFSPVPIRFKHVRGCTYCNENSVTSVDDTEIVKWNLCGCRISHHSMDSYLSSVKTVTESLPVSTI